MYRKKILLLSMPFGALERQALGISLLKSILAEKDIRCDLRYLTFTFAELIGADEYIWISNDLPHIAFVGEWVFANALYGEDPVADEKFIREVLQSEWKLGEDDITRILDVRNLVQHFMDYCFKTVPWEDYAMVGFTSTFEQNIASLALAKRIKEGNPRVKIVFGGGNWEGEMGEELHRNFPFIDYVCTGEADDSFPTLVDLVLSGNVSKKSLTKVKGIVYRSRGITYCTGAPDLVHDMDRLPFPDYSDYFNGYEETSTADSVVPNLLIETSRGCWWGNKNHCTFCGLNGRTLCFRSKNPQRAVQEIEQVVDKWKFDMIQAVDNVIDMGYFKNFLPAMAGRDLTFFYEIRTNLTRKQVKILREAGVTKVQPGIESLSDHVLKLMNKGTTALRNIQVLKWCKEYGISVGWNLLYGFPGETREDYSEMMDTLFNIRFLEPPTGLGPIRMDRFSPYYDDSGKFGLTNVRPITAYQHLYPFSEHALGKIAYYFDFDYSSGVDPSSYTEDVVDFVQRWQENPDKGSLKSIAGEGDRLFLIDSRSCAVRPSFVLSGRDRSVYEYCDSLRSSGSVTKHLKKESQVKITGTQVRRFLDALVANRLMVTDGKNYLSLAIRSTP
jgi:ribosomal peptide maturation radical SAM protein 1